MGAPEKSQSNANSMQRVKVYRLNDDGKWDDQGTGHVTVDYLERSEELGLFVYDEDDNETLLLHRISSDDIYRKQEDTIISWRDPEYATELALSFQEPGGCSYIWDHICNVQRNMHFNTLNSEAFHNVNSELRDLPAVELSTLPLILKGASGALIGILMDDYYLFGEAYAHFPPTFKAAPLALGIFAIEKWMLSVMKGDTYGESVALHLAGAAVVALVSVVVRKGRINQIS